MPKFCYVPKRFNQSSVAVIEQANTIIADYAAQGATALRDDDVYEAVLAKEKQEKQEKTRLKAVAKRWTDVTDFLEGT